MTCDFPVVGPQEVMARFNTSFPQTIAARAPMASFVFAANIDIPQNFTKVLNALGAQNLSGKIEPHLTLDSGRGYRGLKPDMEIASTDVPASKAFVVGAAGDVPSLIFDRPGAVKLTVAKVVVDFRIETDDGSYPDPAIARFRTLCSLPQPYVVQTLEVSDALPRVGELDLSEDFIDFGPLTPGDDAERTIDIRNTGWPESVSVTSIKISPENSAFMIRTKQCSGPIAASDSCPFSVAYAPVYSGDHNAQVVVEGRSEQGEQLVKTLALSGTGSFDIAKAGVGGRSSFPETEVGQTAYTDLVITNEGIRPLEFRYIGVEGPEFSAESTDCRPLGPFDSCSVRIAFTPTYSGYPTGTLWLETNDAVNPFQSIKLGGRGFGNWLPRYSSALEFSTVEGEAIVGSSEALLAVSGFTSDGVYRKDGDLVGLSTNMTLAPTSVTLPVQGTFKTYQATLHLEFSPEAMFEGDLINFWSFPGRFFRGVFLNGQYEVRVPRITVPFFGQDLLIGGGSNCRTSAPVDVSLLNDGDIAFDLRNGGRLKAEFDLPELENCGLFTRAINRSFVSTGNVMMLEFSNAN